MRPVHALATAGAAVLSLSTLTACGGSDEKGGTNAGVVSVTSTDKACEISKKDLPAGKTVFKITNKGDTVTEVYVYAPGDKIVTERENIGPGTVVDLPAELVAGMSHLRRKPRINGDGLRHHL